MTRDLCDQCPGMPPHDRVIYSSSDIPRMEGEGRLTSDEWVRRVAMHAPPLTDEQRAEIQRIFATGRVRSAPHELPGRESAKPGSVSGAPSR